MINEILAFWTPGPIELIIIAIVFFVVFMIPAALIIFIVIYLGHSSKQSRRLSSEVEKLTEEVNKLKQQRQ
ncbi:MAG: hypothetical protein ACETVZ_07490 [Phycisphaerae bacterium]